MSWHGVKEEKWRETDSSCFIFSPCLRLFLSPHFTQHSFSVSVTTERSSKVSATTAAGECVTRDDRHDKTRRVEMSVNLISRQKHICNYLIINNHSPFPSLCSAGTNVRPSRIPSSPTAPSSHWTSCRWSSRARSSRWISNGGASTPRRTLSGISVLCPGRSPAADSSAICWRTPQMRNSPCGRTPSITSKWRVRTR